VAGWPAVISLFLGIHFHGRWRLQCSDSEPAAHHAPPKLKSFLAEKSRSGQTFHRRSEVESDNFPAWRKKPGLRRSDGDGGNAPPGISLIKKDYFGGHDGRAKAQSRCTAKSPSDP